MTPAIVLTAGQVAQRRVIGVFSVFLGCWSARAGTSPSAGPGVLLPGSGCLSAVTLTLGQDVFMKPALLDRGLTSGPDV